jgi:hypothetical protein
MFDTVQLLEVAADCSLSNILVISIDLRSVYEPGNVLCGVRIFTMSILPLAASPCHPSQGPASHQQRDKLSHLPPTPESLKKVWVWNKTCFQVEICWNMLKYVEI